MNDFSKMQPPPKCTRFAVRESKPTVPSHGDVPFETVSVPSKCANLEDLKSAVFIGPRIFKPQAERASACGCVPGRIERPEWALSGPTGSGRQRKVCFSLTEALNAQVPRP